MCSIPRLVTHGDEATIACIHGSVRKYPPSSPSASSSPSGEPPCRRPLMTPPLLLPPRCALGSSDGERCPARPPAADLPDQRSSSPTVFKQRRALRACVQHTKVPHSSPAFASSDGGSVVDTAGDGGSGIRNQISGCCLHFIPRSKKRDTRTRKPEGGCHDSLHRHASGKCTVQQWPSCEGALQQVTTCGRV